MNPIESWTPLILISHQRERKGDSKHEQALTKQLPLSPCLAACEHCHVRNTAFIIYQVSSHFLSEDNSSSEGIFWQRRLGKALEDVSSL